MTTEDIYGPNLELTEEGKKAFQRSCFQCDKFNVCYIWRELQRTLVSNQGSSDKQKLPINVDKLAVICSLYYPKSSEESK